ncbi:amino acid adenylation domain-containing protein [Candidatus Poribacteria bacterium]
MRTVFELISQLRSLDIRLFVDDDYLGYEAPEGALTPELRNELVENKEEILMFLREVESSSRLAAPPILPVPRNVELPLSFAQQRLWFLDQLVPNSSTYNMPSAIRLTGSLDVSALERTLGEIVRRHEVLRTTFANMDGNPVQVISEDTSFTLPIVDLQKLPETEREAEAIRMAGVEAQQPFDLAQGPLFRTKLLSLAEDDHVLLLTIHHIVSDGWSMGIFRRELSTLYEAFSTGKPSPLPDLPIQYADFAIWQREWLQGEALESLISYWKKQLADVSHALELTPDRPRPTIQTYRGESQSLTLSEPLTSALKALSHREGVSLFMTLLAAFKVLLCRHTGQDDIFVGSPIANRNRVKIEGLIGFFVNTLVLRTSLSGNPSFLELLDRTRDVCLEAYAHQDIPFEDLVAELQPERDLSRTPFFQVWVNMVGTGDNQLELPGLIAKSFRADRKPSAKFDLTLYIGERDDEISFRFVYNADLFEAERMAEMLQQFSYVLTQVADSPEERISHISLLMPSTRQVLPKPSQSLYSEAGEAINTQFSNQARRTPERAAVVDTNGVWKYAELDARSNQLANYLCSSGILPQDVVAIYAHRSAALVCAILGVLKAGAAFTILDPIYPASRLIDCLRAAKPRGWIQLEEAGEVPEALKSFVANSSYCCHLELPQRWGKHSRSLLNDHSTEYPKVVHDPDMPAYVAFTSGSSGTPKYVLGTHRPVSHFLKWYYQTFELSHSDRFSMLSGLSHDPLLRDIFAPLLLGATVSIPQQETIETPGRLANWMQREKLTVAHLTPAMSQLLTETATESIDGKCPDLRYAFFGGDVLTEYHVTAIRRLAPSVICVNFYGTTETPQAMGYYIVHPPVEGLQKAEAPVKKQKIPLGRGIDDVQLLVLSNSRQLAGIREIGEICVRTPYLSIGYADDDDLTRERFITNPFTREVDDRIYRTGDMGCYLPDGNIEFLGRADRQVKIRGYRIELGEIDTVLGQHQGVRQAVALVHEDLPGGEHLVAYVVPGQGNPPEISELRLLLAQRLPRYMIPSYFVLLDSIPLTANGKVDYRALPPPDTARTESEEASIAPRDELESKLAEIWKEVLSIDSVGVRDSFFDLGGHSLLAVRLFSQIQKVFGRDLPLTTLFQTPTIEQLANVIRQGEPEKAQPFSPLVEIQPDGFMRPLFCIHGCGGEVLTYRKLANHLPAELPVYALRAQGMYGERHPHSRYSDMAACYIKEIRNVQPEGPYLLAGVGAGGLTALEVAQQLLAQGQEVALLIMIDVIYFTRSELDSYRNLRSQPAYMRDRNTARAEPSREVPSDSGIYSYQRPLLHYVRSLIYYLKKGQLHRPILNRLDKYYWKFAYSSIPKRFSFIRRRIDYMKYVRRMQARAQFTYYPKSYPGRILYFLAEDRERHFRRNEWQELGAGGIEIHTIPGSHRGLLKEPNIRALVGQLKASLDKMGVDD